PLAPRGYAAVTTAFRAAARDLGLSLNGNGRRKEETEVLARLPHRRLLGRSAVAAGVRRLPATDANLLQRLQGRRGGRHGHGRRDRAYADPGTHEGRA